MKCSYDFGITWSNVTTNFISDVSQIIYGNNMWIATGYGDVNTSIQFSYNGISWSNCTNGFNTAGNTIGWNGSYYVAAGQDTASSNARIKFSFNGKVWQNSVINPLSGNYAANPNISWNGSAWSLGTSQPGGPLVVTSTDGINWYAGSGSINTSFVRVAGWTGTKFIADGPTYITTSSNGSNYVDTSYSLSTWGYPSQVVTKNGVTVMTTIIGTYNLLYSTDYGTTFSNSDYTFTNRGWATATIGSYFLAAGSSSSGTSNFVRSTNGSNWSAPIATGMNYVLTIATAIIDPGTTTLTVVPNDLKVFGDLYLTGNITSVSTSVTLSTVALFTSNTSNYFATSFGTAVSTINTGTLILIGGQSGGIRYSLDLGITWGNVTTNFAGIIYQIIYGNNMWIAAGAGTTSTSLQYSFDGFTWYNCTNGFNIEGDAIGWNGIYFVATGRDNSSSYATMKYSYNGITWVNSVKYAVNANIGTYKNVAWNGKAWCVGSGWPGAGPSLSYSLDGSNWYSSDGPTNTINTYTTFVGGWTGTQFIANGNTYFTYSTDGQYFTYNTSYPLSTWGSPGQLVVLNGVTVMTTSASGSHNLIYSLDYGSNWAVSDYAFTAGYAFTSVATLGSMYFAGGSNTGSTSNFVRSTNGSNWGSPINTGISVVQTIAAASIFTGTSTLTYINNDFKVFGNAAITMLTYPATQFALDVNGPTRGAIFYSTVTAGGTLTITASNYFGVFYNITASGTYTINVPASQPTSNIGKYYTFRNNSGADLSVTFTGGTGITSPFTIYSNASATIVAATTSTYALF
jgi:hypothetical protein